MKIPPRSLYILVFILIINLARVNAQDEDEIPRLIKELVTQEECLNPCWLSIEVLVTDEKEVRDALTNYGIEFDVVDIFEGLRLYNFEIVSDFYPLANVDKSPGSIWINPKENRVGRIDIPVDFHINDLIEALGEPSLITHPDYFELLYLEEGVIFYLNSDTQRVWAATFLTEEFLVNEYMSYVEVQGWDEIMRK